MKKSIALFLALALICCLIPYSFAESKAFDYQGILANRAGYEFDKFDKTWNYYGAYAEYFSDASIIVGLQTTSSKTGNPSLTTLYVKIIDKNGNKLYEPTSIDFLINDDIYSYKSMLPSGTSSSIPLGENGLLLLDAIQNSEAYNVAIKIGTKERGSFTLDDLDSSEYNELKEFCRVYLKYKMWDYTEEQEKINGYETMFPLSINGEIVKPE